MRICGIIAEYNPFHNGHQYHIEQTRKITGADAVVCLMSGHFTQRGEPAVFDKWTRAAAAVIGGADAVVELPLLTAVQSAEGFAMGGVALLASLGVRCLSFGSETDDIGTLREIAGVLAREPRSFRRSLKAHLAQGNSFPKARMLAAFPDAPEQASMPNAVLAIEYLKAIQRKHLKMQAFAVQRVGSDYHSADCDGCWSSATAIRGALAGRDLQSAFESMPEPVGAYIRAQLARGLSPVCAGAFDRELLFLLRARGPGYIRTLQDVGEGLENRIWEAAKTCTTREALIEKVKTKRYTHTRISRILLYALLGITRDMAKKHNAHTPQYARILAVKDPSVLSALSKTASVSLIAGGISGTPYRQIDIAASDVYALTQAQSPFNRAARDFTEGLSVGP